MSSILDISIAIPDHQVESDELIQFYEQGLASMEFSSIFSKLKFLSRKTKIQKRYSCIPDFNGKEYELFKGGDFVPTIEQRTEVYKREVIPLASKSIDALFENNDIAPSDVTHLITVSCTGLFAPGLEFHLAEKYGLQHAEKIALNFIGCYAAIKAMKLANTIGLSNPEACILIVCVELCSLHFYPSLVDEDIIANLLFADGASALFVCGDSNPHMKKKVVLRVDQMGSAYIPGTFDLMTWNISSTAFRMYLDKEIVNVIKKNIGDVVHAFLDKQGSTPRYWAIHPGGIKILEAVKEGLHLNEANVELSMDVLREYGNMSSPTILFILQRIFDEIRNSESEHKSGIFTCAFGPGLSIEMIHLSAISAEAIENPAIKELNYVV